MGQSLIIDAHQHFWLLARGDYAWISPDLGLPLYRDYLPEDIAPILRLAGVDQTVVVQATPTEAETEFLLEIATKYDFVAGVVGWVDMEDVDFETKLLNFNEHEKFCGIRVMLQDIGDDAYILRPKVLENLQILQKHDISLDILTKPAQLAHVTDALRNVSNIRAVVNHISKPAIGGDGYEAWAFELAEIAELPSVYCKLSGIITEVVHDQWGPQDLEPYIKHAIDVFGVERLMFGSDWPVCLLAGQYTEALNALIYVLKKEMSPTDISLILGENAINFYQLGETK